MRLTLPTICLLCVFYLAPLGSKKNGLPPPCRPLHFSDNCRALPDLVSARSYITTPLFASSTTMSVATTMKMMINEDNNETTVKITTIFQVYSAKHLLAYCEGFLLQNMVGGIIIIINITIIITIINTRIIIIKITIISITVTIIISILILIPIIMTGLTMMTAPPGGSADL